MHKRSLAETSPEKDMADACKKGKNDSDRISDLTIADLKSVFDEKQQHLATKADIEEVRVNFVVLLFFKG